MTYQLLGGAAIIVSLAGTWLAVRSRRSWLVCIASTILWLPALVTGNQWTAVGNCALSVGICLRNFLVHSAAPATNVSPAANMSDRPGQRELPMTSVLNASAARAAVSDRLGERSWPVP